jgi:chaperonin GroEL
MSKMLKFNEKALDAMLRGVKSLAKAVIVTLGPKGRNVVIKKDYGVPVSTKDGVTVAKEIVLKDKFENMGAQLIKEASAKTSDVAGDGTTTAIVLAQEIFTEGVKNVIAGANPMDIKKGIDKSVALIIEELSRLSKPVTTPEEIKQIATISANNDEEIGQMIANAMEKVGKDGIISVSEAKGIETELDVVEGMQFDKGYVSPYFITNAEKMIVEYDNAQIFITDKKLSSARDIVPILEKIATAGSKPLLIIAEDIDSEALATLVVNKIKGGMAICAVKAPAFGDRRKEILQDIGILTGATVVSEDIGMKLEDIDLDVLGSAKKIKITKDDTTIIDGEGELDQIKKRITQIKQEMNVSTSDYDREKLEERLAKLVGGVAVINVGAPTEAEMKERKARVEDALHATRAATADGIVPGGGVALLRALTVLEKLDLKGDENIGKEIVKKACYAPSIAIANNCGMQGNLIAEKILEKKGSFGFNGLTGEFSDLVKDGVVDPAFVTKSALINAASISGLLITAAVMITDKPEPKGSSPSMDPSMMGGMGGMGMPGMGMGGMPGMM